MLKPDASIGHAPKYAMVRDYLSERIDSGEYQPGDRLPTEDSLVEILGVSKGPIRQAVSDLEQRGVLRKVQGRGTFVCEPADARPRGGATEDECICALAPSFRLRGHVYVEELLCGIEAAALELGKRVDIIFMRPKPNTPVPPALLAQVLRQASRSRGVISIGNLSLAEARAFLATGVPLLSIHTDYEEFGLKIDTIPRPYPGFCAQAARYLMDLGHRRLMFMGIKQASHVGLDAFRQAAEQGGATVETLEEDNPFRVLEAIKLRLDRATPPTAVFASRTDLSQILIHMRNTWLLRTPEEISALGYAEAPLAGAITQMAPPLVKTGRAAVRRLLKLDERLPPLEARIIDRGSCGRV